MPVTPVAGRWSDASKDSVRWLDMSKCFCSCPGVGPQRRPSHKSLASVGVRWRGARCAHSRWWSHNRYRRARTRTLGTGASRGAERSAAEQKWRKQQVGVGADRLAELEWRVERERVEAKTVELERQTVLVRLVAAMLSTRGRSRLLRGTSDWNGCPTRQEMKLCRVEAAQIARGYGVRFAVEEGTRRRSGLPSWTRPRTAWTSVTLPCVSRATNP